MKTIRFITWDEATDGIAVEIDGREVWADTAHDGWDQFFRHVMPRGVPVLLEQDTRPSERDAPKPRLLDKGERNELRHLLQVLTEAARAVRNAIEPETGVLAITDEAWLAQWQALTGDLDFVTARIAVRGPR